MNKYLVPLTALLILTLLSTAAVAVDFKGAAKVINFTGDVTITRGGAEVKPAKGLDLMIADLIRTGTGKISFLLSDNSMVALTADSHFTISEYSHTGGKRKGAFSLAFGKVKSVVARSIHSDSSFTVITPTAVAGVRGTEFYTSFDPLTKKTDIAVLEGIVSVRGEGVGGKFVFIDVGANKKTSVVEKQPPAPPVIIPKMELQELKKSFDIGRGEETRQDTKKTKTEAVTKDETKDQDQDAEKKGKEEAKESEPEKKKTANDTSMPQKDLTKKIDPKDTDDTLNLLRLERMRDATMKIDSVKENIPQQKDSTGIKARW